MCNDDVIHSRKKLKPCEEAAFEYNLLTYIKINLKLRENRNRFKSPINKCVDLHKVLYLIMYGL